MRLSKPPCIADAYAALALAFGAWFLVMTPPFGVGDETAHFERSYEVATGAFLGAEGIPLGMQRLIDDAFGGVKSGATVASADFRRWAAIPLDRAEVVAWPEPVRVVMRLHSPVCYLHLAPVIAVGAAFGAPPLLLLYFGRLTALLVGVFLVRAAIAAAPPGLRLGLAVIAFFPTAIVYFAGFNIESLLVGLAFLYFALIAGHCAEPTKRLRAGDVAQLAGLAFLVGQFKTGYLLLPAIAVLLPTEKFADQRTRWATLALIVVPGIAASLGWAFAVKNLMLGDIAYSTLDGNHVQPAEQLRSVLSDPLAYLGVVARTLFASDAPVIAWKTLIGTAGWTNIALPPPFLALSTVAAALIWMSGEKAPERMRTRSAALLQIGVFAATALAILTLVYFQWNGVGDAVITGFQGRYLLATLPLLLASAPMRFTLLQSPQRRAALAFGASAVSLFAMAAAVFERYY
ncbi:MAG: DUF2142 domain-containing protein [Parvularculaceae bacterium]|nr:DUF2142 domain-containing protein [Parvularculaceae bacterium]